MPISKNDDSKQAPPNTIATYVIQLLAVFSIIWLCGSTLHLLAPDDFSGAFLFRTTPVSSIQILREAFIDASMATRSTVYTEVDQRNSPQMSVFV